MPEALTNAMGAVGGMLPAVGMALLLKVMITKPTHWTFFLFGFVAYAVLGVGSVPLTIIAIVIAVLANQASGTSNDSTELESLE